MGKWFGDNLRSVQQQRREVIWRRCSELLDEAKGELVADSFHQVSDFRTDDGAAVIQDEYIASETGGMSRDSLSILTTGFVPEYCNRFGPIVCCIDRRHRRVQVCGRSWSNWEGVDQEV